MRVKISLDSQNYWNQSFVRPWRTRNGLGLWKTSSRRFKSQDILGWLILDRTVESSSRTSEASPYQMPGTLRISQWDLSFLTTWIPDGNPQATGSGAKIIGRQIQDVYERGFCSTERRNDENMSAPSPSVSHFIKWANIAYIHSMLGIWISRGVVGRASQTICPFCTQGEPVTEISLLSDDLPEKED